MVGVLWKEKQKKKYTQREGEMESSTSVRKVPFSNSAEYRSTQAGEETLEATEGST